MARKRELRPSFFTNEYLASLPFEARLLFAGLWTIADRRGRLEDRPLRIKAQLFAYDNLDIDKLLQMLADSEDRFIIRYVADGKRYIQIPNFEKNQNFHKEEAESVIPPPPTINTTAAPCEHPANTTAAPCEQALYLVSSILELETCNTETSLRVENTTISAEQKFCADVNASVQSTPVAATCVSQTEKSNLLQPPLQESEEPEADLSAQAGAEFQSTSDWPREETYGCIPDGDCDNRSAHGKPPDVESEPIEEALFNVPCLGKGRAKGEGNKFPVARQFVEQLEQAYPAVDVPGEILRAIAWCIANPRKIKTYGGVPRFLNSWMERTQNKGGSMFVGGNGSPPHNSGEMIRAPVRRVCRKRNPVSRTPRRFF